MDTFSIALTEKAFADLEELSHYLHMQLVDPETVKQQQERIKQACLSLAQLPMRYALVPDGYLRKQGVRFFPVDTYLVFYVVNPSEHKVYILRILYSRRDWQILLSSTTSILPQTEPIQDI